MEAGRSRLILLGMLAALAILQFSMSSASPSNHIAVQAYLSESQVFDSQKFSVTATVTDIGNSTASNVHVNLVLPHGWGILLLSPKGSNDTATDALPLQPNMAFIAEFNVTVPKDALASSYNLIVNASSTIGDNQSTISVQVPALSSLPFGTTEVPLSVIILFLPGLVTVAIVLWFRNALSSSWQSGVLYTLFGFALGYAEWEYFDNGVPFLSPLTPLQILNLNPDVITAWNAASVLLWSVAIAIGMLALLEGITYFRAYLFNLDGKLADLDTRIQDRINGYVESDETAWNFLLRTSLEDTALFRGGGWAPLVEVTVQNESGDTGQNKPPPAATTTTETDKSTNTTTKQRGDTVETTKEIDSITKTQSPDVSGGGSEGKTSTIRGLLQWVDEDAPFDIELRPQYEVIVDTGNHHWNKVEKKLEEVKKASLKWKERHGLDADHGKLFDELNSGCLPSDDWPYIRTILKYGGSLQPLDDKLLKQVAWDDSRKALGVNVTDRTLVKGGQILKVVVSRPRPNYFFTPIGDPKVVTPLTSHPEQVAPSPGEPK